MEFSEYGGELQHCTLTERTDVPAEIDGGQSRKSTKDVGCAKDRDVWLRTFERRLLERCVLAETATVGMIHRLLFSGSGRRTRGRTSASGAAASGIS